MELSVFFPKTPDFQPCCHRIVFEADGALAARDIEEALVFADDIKCKELHSKLFRKTRIRKQRTQKDRVAQLAALSRCLMEFLTFTGQSEASLRLQNCKIYAQLTEALCDQVDDSDFSFTSLEEDEFYPLEGAETHCTVQFAECSSSDDSEWIH